MACDGHRAAVAAALDSRATGHAAPPLDARRQRRWHCTRERHSPAPRAARHRGALVHDALALHAALPLRPRELHHRTPPRLVGRGTVHLALLDGLRSSRRRPGGMGHRRAALYLALLQEPHRRDGALAVLAPRLGDAALLPARRTVDRVPRPAPLDRR